MKAMIFAAGLGTRLKPLTNDRPKALVEVAGKTLLEHTINKLKNSGFNQIVINVHHFGDQIINFVKANQNFGIDIAISDERMQLLDTGGGIKQAALQIGSEPFLIHNVDIFSNADLKSLYDAHMASDNDATLLVSNRKSSRKLLFDTDSYLRAWHNLKSDEFKPSGVSVDGLNEYAFSGIHVFSPQLVARMASYPAVFPVMDFYLDQCGTAKIKAHIDQELNLIDVGKIDTLEEAARFISGQPERL